ncbi:glycosyltransferase [Exiguobacterium acetylicum]|uniref:glycosyltransferase n=1 Tax=Exiguobacterium acetylicum TaxID=41170 RepID=UPI001AD606BC|nr:glycosyltransferase [Exiguobacterium acetylicum]
MYKKKIGLFSFDGPMYRDCNGVYCNTTITSNMFERYFEVVDELIVVIRTFHLTTTYVEAKMNKVELKGLKIIEVENLNSLKGILNKKRNALKIEKYINKADMIFARMPSIISDMTISMAKKRKKPYLVEVGGCAWDSHWNHSLVGKIVAPYMFFKERKNILDASFAIYVTQKWLQKRYPTKGMSTSASNVYLEKNDFKVLDNRKIRIKNLNKKNIFKIGTTAAIDVKYKGQDDVVKAISNLKKQGFNIQYELVGGGDKKYIQNLSEKLSVSENVVFKGLLLKKDVIEWMDQIDLYIQPSKQEGLPRALVEAISRACPAIGSNTAGIPELLNDDCIFKAASIREIENLIKKRYMNKEILIKESEANFLKSKDFSIELLNENRNKIYKRYRDVVIKK